ncbi:hypothetical protein E4T42_08939 [Aureobasidium subglaciale]|nr:hypothetical protein E4T42_08939 [Aureobasidium subglaciale]
MIPHVKLLKSLLSPAITQRASPAVNFRTMIQRLMETVDDNKKLLDENEQLRVRNYELKRELEQAYRKLCSSFASLCAHNHRVTLASISPTSTKIKDNIFSSIMEAAAETQNDLVNLLNEKNIALTETKVAAAQSAEAVNMIIDENIQLKTEVQRLREEIKDLRTKLWNATVEERKMDAGRVRDVLGVL